MVKIFGKEPAVIAGAIEAFLLLAVVMNLGISQDDKGIVMLIILAATTALTAWATANERLAVSIGVVKALITAYSFYVAPLSNDQVTAIVGAFSVVFGMFQRTQTSPVDTPISEATHALAA